MSSVSDFTSEDHINLQPVDMDLNCTMGPDDTSPKEVEKQYLFHVMWNSETFISYIHIQIFRYLTIQSGRVETDGIKTV